MGTRSTTHFIDSRIKEPSAFGSDGYPNRAADFATAIVYRHWDGYPNGAGKDLVSFLYQCKRLKDSRLSDDTYLAAKYVVFLADQFASDGMWKDPQGKLHSSSVNRKNPNEKREYVNVPRKNKLNFLSVGVMRQDPTDIEYRYVVDCGKIGMNGLPEVRAYKVQVNEDGTDKLCEEVKIPRYKFEPRPVNWINQRTFASQTQRGVSYTVEQNDQTGEFRCNCPGFHFRKTCKHVMQVTHPWLRLVA